MIIRRGVMLWNGKRELANTLSCTQSCIAKNHNRILNLIRKSLEY